MKKTLMVAGLFLAGHVNAEPVEFRGLEIGKATQKEVLAVFPSSSCDSPTGCIVMPLKAATKSPCGMAGVTPGWLDCSVAHSREELRSRYEHLWFGGVQADYFYFGFHEGVLERASATIKPVSLDTVAAALQEKFGKPQEITQETIQNRMGAKFINDRFVWRTGNVTIVAARYANGLESGTVNYRLSSSEERLQREAATQAKENAKRL